MTVFHDRAQITGSARITPEGYFVADALVARANNVQDYRASELGLTDRDPSAVVRVFRPEAEVFAADSLATAARLPVTLDHPAVMVDASNWREFARGETDANVLRDGEYIRVPLRVTDAGAVQSMRSDRREFSLGYTADVKLEAGVFDGLEYDAVATNLRYNHLAACRAARGGPELRIIDERPDPRQLEGPTPMPKIVMVDGLPVDVSNPDTAEQVVRNAIAARDTANAALADSQKAFTAEQAKVAGLEAEVSTLKDAADKATPTPAQLRDAAADYARTVSTAKALGATVSDEMDVPAIKAAAVSVKLGDAAKAYTPAQVETAFDVLAAGVTDSGANRPDPLRAALQDGKPKTQGDQATAFADARAKRFDRLASGHRNLKPQEA